MRLQQVIRAGLVAWAGMTTVMALAKRLGVSRMHLMDIEGSMVTTPNSRQASILGFFMHLGMSLWIGLVYALGYRITPLRPNWRSGLAGGIVHWAIATLVTGLVSRVYPNRRHLAMPGFGGLALGLPTALSFLAGHLIFGTLFGRVYERTDER